MLNWLRKIFTPESYMQWVLEKTLQNEAFPSIRTRIQNILDLDVSVLSKYLFLYESYVWINKSINRLSKEEKLKLLQEIESFDLTANSWRIWAYNHLVYLCEQ